MDQMPTDAEFSAVVKAFHEMKGELLYLNILLMSVSRALSEEQKHLMLAHFHKLAEETRTSALNSEADDQVAVAFELYVEALLNPKRAG